MSLQLYLDIDSAEIREDTGLCVWQLSLTPSDVVQPAHDNAVRLFQPVIHANGSLVEWDVDTERAPRRDAWYLSHEESDFASVDAAIAFEQLPESHA